MVSTLKERPKKAGQKPEKVNGRKADKSGTTPRPKKWDVTARDWARYQKHKSDEMRQTLLNKYVPLVQNVATRMAMGFPRSVELTDLINTGVIGLIEAFGHFDPDRGVKFDLALTMLYHSSGLRR